jgi:hypothetical protein
MQSLDISASTPFGRTVTDAEFLDMVTTGRLEGALLERFWRMSDFQSPMPACIELFVSRSDVDKVIREAKREKRRRSLKVTRPRRGSGPIGS